MATRQQSQRRDLEAQYEQLSGLSKETESKLVNLQSLLRKLAYFNRATDEILRVNSKEAIIRQQTTLKTKVSKAYGLIELIQCLKIDAGESDKTIDEWTSENNGRLHEYEAAIEELNRRLLDEEKIQREIERQEKIRQEVEARALIRHEEEQAEFEKRAREEKFALSLEEKNEPAKWPEQLQIKPSESRMVKEVMKVTIPKEADFVDSLLEKFQLLKAVEPLDPQSGQMAAKMVLNPSPGVRRQHGVQQRESLGGCVSKIQTGGNVM
ncbi:Hypothetical predicted protein [Paramuricea clavata]|uniref:Uncharacterized protein n=1 Tax=Paramuricea clavata TaxID=317549 RepID=A0A6S7FVC5_PARCT|nr:Hypothetical predicted protein [Paramuricea clavata]